VGHCYARTEELLETVSSVRAYARLHNEYKRDKLVLSEALTDKSLVHAYIPELHVKMQIISIDKVQTLDNYVECQYLKL
jgi:hypothetical protein